VSETVADVVVALPVPRVFSYAVPPELVGRIGPGQRVRVPFQTRARPGVVVALVERDAAGLQPLEATLDPVPALTGPLLALTRWVADETVSAWGETVARALPPAGRATPPADVAPDPIPAGPGPLAVAYGAGRDHLVEAAVRRARDEGRGVLVLAPEIEIARAWSARLAADLGEPVALVTSEERPRQRWASWWACRSGAVRVAVGTRVAAFLPLRDLGAAIVLDEHDPAHKALDSPRWHARELAVERTRREGAAGLLVSGTPSLESWARVRAGTAAAEEVKGAGWPAVHRVDLRAVEPADRATALTRALRDAVSAALAAGQSALLVLNRLGYGRALGCQECGAVRRCAGCRVTLVYHHDAHVLGCRLCGARVRAAAQCGRCRGRRQQPLGWGTERVEAEARAAFPSAGVARYDGEVAPERAAAVRAAFRSREARVVVGTSMALRLAGEAPVGLAALVLADTTLNLPDFRAAERTFQLAWHLAESVAPGGRLWVQSYYPEHPALEAVALGARERFYEREWTERQELGYPPVRRMGLVLAEGREAARLADDLAGRARAEGLTVLGPAPMPRARMQVILLGGDELPGALARALAPLRGRRRLPAGRLLVDVDPVELP
jgi:primosomal protein N' (replication factor Y)